MCLTKKENEDFNICGKSLMNDDWIVELLEPSFEQSVDEKGCGCYVLY